ncbi:MAG: carboxypeptidase-like regulatory domain-containing protein, partial [Candidatus Thermoplasmatota archaeon]|nr:carboxypeptidase-like regulatory domain-containing protein [Candidatus Thermoplasmatota archaeon]
MYAAAMIMLGEKGEETVVNLLHDLQEVTGHSIRYFAADARMFPFSWSNTGIFYAPTVLSDQDVNDFFETLIIGEERDEDNNIVTTTVPMTAKEFIEWRDNAPPEHIRYASDYELKYKEQFYNSMFYKGYIGYSGKDIGSDGIPGLSPALANFMINYPLPLYMPGWMMKHFRLVYLNSGLRILKYYEGAYVNGTVTTESGVPVPNVYVTVMDDITVPLYRYNEITGEYKVVAIHDGIPHDMVLTNETGHYSLIAPFGMKENKYNVTIVASSGNLNPLYKIGDNTLGKKTIHVKEEDAFSRKQIMLNFTIKGASMHGKVSWDDGETVSNGTVLLKTDTKTFTENISSNGEYRFDDIAPATYKLWLNTSGHEFYVRDVIPVSDTDKTEDITLKGRVSGNLDYDENANVTNANVTVSLFDETNLTRMNVTSNESYSFEKILPGKYTLSVDEDNYLNFTGSFNLGLNEEKTVNVTLQSAVFISGTTYNTEPMKNVTLRFKGVMNTTVVSDETGFYKLKLIPGGYSISSTYIDNNAVYIFNDVLKVENLSITKNVSLKKGERTYGYVCYEKYVGNNTVNETSGENKTVNETLSNVHITFKSDNITVKTVSNSTGYYEVYLPKDNYTILVSYGYNETSTLVLLKPFNTTEKEQNITLIEGIKVYGILHYDLDETYDKTVAALILFESENGTVETTSDADGYYIVYLAVGNYNVSVNASDFILFSKETFVNKTIVTTIVNETTNETVNTTINEMWYNISLNPINITVSCVISSALLPEETINLTNVTVSFNASDDIGI